MPDVPSLKFDPPVNIFVGDAVDHSLEGFCVSCPRLYFNRNEVIDRASEEIHFKRGVFPFIIEKRHTQLCQSLRCNALKESPFVGPQIFVCPEIVLDFVVQHGNKKAGIFEIYFVFLFIIVPFER